jgi:hypothetical protein
MRAFHIPAEFSDVHDFHATVFVNISFTVFYKNFSAKIGLFMVTKLGRQ